MTLHYFVTILYIVTLEWEVHITDQGLSPISEMTYTVSSGTLNSTVPYRNIRR